MSFDICPSSHCWVNLPPAFKSEVCAAKMCFVGVVECNLTFYLQLGVSKAFSVGEFDNIASDVRLKLSSVSHVASIDVTVDGTVGAAATGQFK